MGWQFRTARRCARINRSFHSGPWSVVLLLAATAAITRTQSDAKGTVQASSAAIAAGTKVGTFELGAPEIDQFVLHGTLPIPAGIYPTRDGSSPFKIRDPEGNITSAQ